MKSLVIVESPAKAKTINKYLGKDFVVKSSVGHIRDLPVNAQQVQKTGSKVSMFDRMGIYPDQHWKANYQVLPGKANVVKELRSIAKQSQVVYLATDLDREGEAIAWHLQELLKESNHNFRRVIFNEITKNAVTRAFSQAGEVNNMRVNAQQTRRFLDRIVGFMVSPVLWNRVARGLSAGRVQSVAVRLIVDREREIQQFVPKEYWRIYADTLLNNAKVRFEVTRFQGKKFVCQNGDVAAAHKDVLRTGNYIIHAREVKPTTAHPSPPFITSTLQQMAASALGFSVKRTMIAAQRLYEAGHITYMRTDSTMVSNDALQAVRELIPQSFGKEYLPESPNFYKSKASAQEAHEAIRPSQVSVQTLDVTGDQQKLYTLIRNRFIASQMTDARYENTVLVIEQGDYKLEAKGRVMLFDGFTRVMGKPRDEVVNLPACQKGDIADLHELILNQHFTSPPARYNEAALVKELEKRGIGRPSTYASIISTIQERGYVRMDNKRLHAEKIGEIVTDLLHRSFDDFMDYAFTAQMEQQLDRIANGELEWKKVLDDFFTDISHRIDKQTDSSKERATKPVPTDFTCSNCSRKMQVRFGKNGVFLGCPGYAEKGDAKCSNTVNLIDIAELPQDTEADESALSTLLRARRRCPICNSSMTPYLIDNNHKLHLCGNAPTCQGCEIEQGEFIVTDTNQSDFSCEKCASPLALKSGRFGKFFACTNSECGTTCGMMVNGKPAPIKMTPVPMPELACQRADDHFVLRDGLTGLFLAASSFPKHRETRPVKVRELLPHKAEIDQKYHYIFNAPLTDSEGNASTVRYSRKANQMYVGSENANGKPTKWGCYFVDGVWTSSPK